MVVENQDQGNGSIQTRDSYPTYYSYGVSSISMNRCLFVSYFLYSSRVFQIWTFGERWTGRCDGRWVHEQATSGQIRGPTRLLAKSQTSLHQPFQAGQKIFMHSSIYCTLQKNILQMWRNCEQKRNWLNPNTVDKIMFLNIESTVTQGYPSCGIFYQHISLTKLSSCVRLPVTNSGCNLAVQGSMFASRGR